MESSVAIRVAHDASQIMRAPGHGCVPRHFGNARVEIFLADCPVVEWAARAKHPRARRAVTAKASRLSGENLARDRGQENCVRPGGLASLGRQRGHALIEIDLHPHQPADLGSACASRHQHLDDRAVSIVAGRVPDGGKLARIEHAIAADLGVRLGRADNWVGIESGHSRGTRKRKPTASL